MYNPCGSLYTTYTYTYFITSSYRQFTRTFSKGCARATLVSPWATTWAPTKNYLFICCFFTFCAQIFVRGGLRGVWVVHLVKGWPLLYTFWVEGRSFVFSPFAWRQCSPRSRDQDRWHPVTPFKAKDLLTCELTVQLIDGYSIFTVLWALL